ncbi:MAG: SprB repeat-containing protein, partial [Saprospiraceae bacterium]
TASGGTGTLEYSSDNGVMYQPSNIFTGLAIGSYDIVVKDANGCTTAAQSVSVTSCFSATVSNTTNVTCSGGNDGTVEITVTGGAAPYIVNGTNSYATNPFTISGLNAGAFSYTITDANSITATVTGTIADGAIVTVTLDNSTDASCNGGNDGSITLENNNNNTTLFSEDFDGSIPNTWTNNAISPNANALWQWSPDGLSQGAYWAGTQPIASPTGANGSVIFDSDFYDNGGVQGAFGSGIAPSPHESHLVSPVIDCSNFDTIVLNFYNFYRNFQSQTFVDVTNDNGTTWMPFQVNATVTGVDKSIINLDISTIAANESAVQFRFRFTGDYYFWTIDDVELIGSQASALTYNWSNNTTGSSISNLSAGTYTVTATDVNGCTATESYPVSEPSAIISSASMTACSNGANGEITVTASGGTGTLEYSSDNGVMYQPSNIFTGLAIGSYDIVVKDANGCTT